jgi:hypothetical protein
MVLRKRPPGSIEQARVGARLALMVTLPLAAIGCASPASPPPPSNAPLVVTGVTTSTGLISCAGAEDIRSTTFTKQSASTRLRITYKDTVSASSTSGGSVSVVGRIDSAAVASPTALRMEFGNVPRGTNYFEFYGSFTLVGYADGVAAGSHTLSFVYESKATLPSNFTCFRATEPFMIEIEER